ncbi:hypothetical protein HanOQP8_Chr01g0012891 [Helianthus annuus]|nr:hypothetical protein HanOQP8_Chr01g0012891 [Helianthus annuus]
MNLCRSDTSSIGMTARVDICTSLTLLVTLTMPILLPMLRRRWMKPLMMSPLPLPLHLLKLENPMEFQQNLNHQSMLVAKVLPVHTLILRN